MKEPPDLTRRGVLGAALAAPLLPGTLFAQLAARPGADPVAARLEQAVRVRQRAAERLERQGVPRHTANGDEEELPGRIACYSKALPHDPLGVVEPRAYGFLLAALRSGKPNDFEEIPLGGPSSRGPAPPSSRPCSTSPRWSRSRWW